MSANEQAKGQDVGSVKTYVAVFAALIFLTFVTVFISVGVDLGQWSLLAAMAVATTKALLVLLIFMHVWHEDKLIVLILATCALFIGLFFGMTMLDTANRGLITEVEDNMYYRDTHNASLVVEVPGHGADAAAEEAAAEEAAPAAEEAAEDAAAE